MHLDEAKEKAKEVIKTARETYPALRNETLFVHIIALYILLLEEKNREITKLKGMQQVPELADPDYLSRVVGVPGTDKIPPYNHTGQNVQLPPQDDSGGA